MQTSERCRSPARSCSSRTRRQENDARGGNRPPTAPRTRRHLRKIVYSFRSPEKVVIGNGSTIPHLPWRDVDDGWPRPTTPMMAPALVGVNGADQWRHTLSGFAMMGLGGRRGAPGRRRPGADRAHGMKLKPNVGGKPADAVLVWTGFSRLIRQHRDPRQLSDFLENWPP